MRKKVKGYDKVIFKSEVIGEAFQKFVGYVIEDDKKHPLSNYKIENVEEEWSYDNKDDFFAKYRHGFIYALFYQEYDLNSFEVRTYNDNLHIKTIVSVSLQNEYQVESVFEIFEKNVKESVIHQPPLNQRITIFIGHGHSDDWRDLKDHLHEKHGFEVNAYEIGERAGLPTKEILEEMLEESSFALLVLTPEDEDIEGKFHARENVIHELGLFQGRLGFERTIAIIAEGTKEFSNIHGVNQLRYSKGNIKEIFGDVLGTIKRELGEN